MAKSKSKQRDVIFISHSSKDKAALEYLKKLLLAKCHNTIDIFLSSDGESIPNGVNWLQHIEKALVECRFAFVFLTRNSLTSMWVPYEMGTMVSRGKRVITVAFIDVSLDQLPLPLGMLQGFNLHNREALSNLVAEVNKELGSTFDTSFSEEEYDRLVRLYDGRVTSLFGKYTRYVREIKYRAEIKSRSTAEVNLDRIMRKELAGILDPSSASNPHTNRLNYGLNRESSGTPSNFQYSLIIDPRLLHKYHGPVASFMDTLRKSLDAFISVILPFESSVRCVTNATQISATYDGTEISFGINYSYSFRNLTFNPQFSERSAQLIMYPDDGAVITDETLVDLVRLHFEQGTLTTAD